MNHSGMGGSVIVMEPTEFENWLSGNAGQIAGRRRPADFISRSVVFRVTAPMAKAGAGRR